MRGILGLGLAVASLRAWVTAVRRTRGAALRAALGVQSETSRPGRGAPLRRLASLAGTRLRPPRPLEQRLGASGGTLSVNDAMSIKVLAAFVGAAAALLLGVVAPPLWLLVPAVVVVAYRIPDLAWARRARRRVARIETQVPEFAELLLVATEAGLGLSPALARSAALIGRPLGDELMESIRQIELGQPIGDELDRLAGRVEAPGLGRLTRTLARSRRLGLPVVGALKEVARDLRAERRAAAESAARRAPVKMLFPLVFLILPAFLLLTVGPVLLATMRSLH